MNRVSGLEKLKNLLSNKSAVKRNEISGFSFFL